MSSNRNRPTKSRNTQQNRLRIIGGKWRGRKLVFPSGQGLRPTTDRVRETLFNWLSPHIAGARCLDLFAGSGALGMEALSRGAAFSCFIDSAPAATRQINENLVTLGCDSGEIHTMTALQWLQQVRPHPDAPFDILFLDPPFGKDLLAESIALLEEKSLLGANALVYLESSQHDPQPALPAGWHLHRDKTAGLVNYQLYCTNSE